MHAEDRFARQRRDLALTFPSSGGTMQVTAVPSAFGMEFLWGMLTDQLREVLTLGGCDRHGLQASLLQAWHDAPRVSGQVVELELRDGDEGLELVGPPDANGDRQVKLLVRPDAYFTFSWDGVERRVPLAVPEPPALPPFWQALPLKARDILAFKGVTEGRLNSALAQMLARSKPRAGVPTVRLPVPLKPHQGAFIQAEALAKALAKVGA